VHRLNRPAHHFGHGIDIASSHHRLHMGDENSRAKVQNVLEIAGNLYENVELLQKVAVDWRHLTDFRRPQLMGM
jgi:hypothetical protein